MTASQGLCDYVSLWGR